MLVDSHCHLDFKDFNEDREAVIERAHASGVTLMQTICTSLPGFERIHPIAMNHESIYCSVGIHPDHVHEFPETNVEELISYTRKPKVIGLGETGLDYYRDISHKDLQIRSFKAHIQASRETGVPLIVHTRSAEEDTASLLKEEMARGAFTGLLHCFTSSDWLAKEAIDLGLYISISGIVTFKNAKELQETVKSLPLERLLVETDAPYLAPMPHRGKRNEPGFTRHTAEFIAQLKGVSYEEVARVTTENFFRLFTRVPQALCA
ncbi:MAG: TatD family hydrolase [Alphaproteobacteria bacterium]|nr:TatD family hydrolase [Alphaproteobacteria bacterium]